MLGFANCRDAWWIPGHYRSGRTQPWTGSVWAYVPEIPWRCRNCVPQRPQDNETGIFINGGKLIKLLAFGLAHDTSIWNKFDVDLHPLAGMLHLFIRFWNIFGVGGLTAIVPIFRRNRYRTVMKRVYPRGLSFTQKITRPALGLRLRMSEMSLRSSGVCLLGCWWGRCDLSAKDCSAPSYRFLQR